MKSLHYYTERHSPVHVSLLCSVVENVIQRRRASTSHIPIPYIMPAVPDGDKPPCYYDSFMYNSRICAFVLAGGVFIHALFE
jgi:hypothetical protein